jgi:hypothetical protein
LAGGCAFGPAAKRHRSNPSVEAPQDGPSASSSQLGGTLAVAVPPEAGTSSVLAVTAAADIVAASRLRRLQAQAQEQQDHECLQQWRQNPDNHIDADAADTIPDSIEQNAVIKPGHCDFIDWVPPGREIARHALSDRPSWKSVGRSDSHIEFKKLLKLAWAHRHATVESCKVPKIRRQHKFVPSACYLAGFCLCNDSGGHLRDFVEGFRAMLRRSLDKDSYPRFWYDKSSLTGHSREARDWGGIVDEYSEV